MAERTPASRRGLVADTESLRNLLERTRQEHIDRERARQERERLERGTQEPASDEAPWSRDRTEDLRWTALIDPSRYPTPAQCAQALDVSEQSFNDWPNLYLTFSPEMKSWGPRLFTAVWNDPVWEAVFTETLTRQAASFLLAPAHTDLLAHLKTMIRLQQPDGSRLLFRFQDTVVLSEVMRLLAPAQTLTLLGPARSWVSLDVYGRALRVEPAPGAGPRPSALVLTAQQTDALDIALSPGTIIAQANETDTTLLMGRSLREQWRTIRARQHRARRHGLSRAEDIALYCVLSLQLPADFDRDGPVARALARAKQARIGFGEAIDEVPVGEWREWDDVLDARRAEEASA